ncbi:MAG: PAS domain-containing protein [Chitinophagaceae bacterium]|nr:PAS domain-containing protein [Chitinophagaceae bacterium]
MKSYQFDKIGVQVTNAVPCLLSYWDKDLICRYANMAYEEWFGLRPEQMVNKITLQELITPENLKLDEALLKNLFTGHQQEFKRQLITPAGESRHILVTLIPNIIAGEVAGFTPI